jgi:hypothetical protein
LAAADQYPQVAGSITAKFGRIVSRINTALTFAKNVAAFDLGVEFRYIDRGAFSPDFDPIPTINAINLWIPLQMNM